MLNWKNGPMVVTMKGRFLYIFFSLVLCQMSVTLYVAKQPNPITQTGHENGISGADYNPDTEHTTPQMIRKAGYSAEAHTVLTEDGYLLEIHRIPGSVGSPSVFLQHGLLGSSADWVIPGKDKALAYILANHGYDVWLGNFRGNTYSRAHTSLSTSDAKFWDFSWHEIGVYDLPAMISYIVERKGNSLDAYIGHSMGTTTFYVMAVERPRIARTVRSMYSLAPVAFLKHLKSPIRFLAPFAYNYEAIARFLGKGEFLPQNSFLKLLAKYGCEIDVWEEQICMNSLFAICGFDKAQFNNTLLPVILSHTPAGASTKTLVHYGQAIESGQFRPYDYGAEKNMKIYNSTEPPDYDLSQISLPIALFYSDNDWLASPIDVMELSKKLSNKLDVYKVAFPKFNHLDFIWGIDAPKFVYQRLLYVMKKHQQRQSNTKFSVNMSI